VADDRDLERISVLLGLIRSQNFLELVAVVVAVAVAAVITTTTRITVKRKKVVEDREPKFVVEQFITITQPATARTRPSARD